MGLEAGTFISDLVATNPVGATDPKSQGDDHIRLIKSTILATFPNITGAMSLTHVQLNAAAIKSEANVFTANQRVTKTDPSLELFESGAGADEKLWRFIATAADFVLTTRTDADAAGTVLLRASRTGTAIDTVDFTATNVRLRTGAAFQIFDASNSDSVTFAHNGTDLTIAGVGTTDITLSGITAINADAVVINMGHASKISNNAGSCQLFFEGAGDTTEWQIGTTGAPNDSFIFFDTTAAAVRVQIDDTSGLLTAFQGFRCEGTLSVVNGADSLAIAHDGTNVTLSTANTDNLDIINVAANVRIRDGAGLQIFNAADTDSVTFIHDGTDLNIASVNTAEINNDTPVNSPNVSAAEWGFKGAPHNEQNGNYTLLLTDAAKRIYKASGGAGETITIPANASVAFPVGTIIEILNDGGGDLSIAITTDTLEELGTGLTGTRTLPDNNKAIIEKVTATLWKYSASS